MRIVVERVVILLDRTRLNRMCGPNIGQAVLSLVVSYFAIPVGTWLGRPKLLVRTSGWGRLVS